MKRFRFRLQRVLDYRNVVKREHELELIRKNSELHENEERLANIIAAQDAATLGETERVTTMAELGLETIYQEALQEALEQQRLLVIQAQQAVEQARDAYIEKAIESETLETLRRKRVDEHREEVRHDEKKTQDKLVVMRHRLTKKR